MIERDAQNHQRPVTATRSSDSSFDALAIVSGTGGPSDQPGAFLLSEDRRQFACICPCGCGAYRDIPIHRDGTGAQRGWLWNGDEATPTLYPSIRDVGTCFWHGYLRAGIFEPVADSGQGQR